MNERIHKLAELTLAGEMNPKMSGTEFDREDFFLPEHQMQAKRIHDYIMAQKPVLTEYQRLTGLVAVYDENIIGDYMHRQGGRNTAEKLLGNFYNKPLDNLSTFEWQHATANYNRIIRVGIKGLIGDIEKSKKEHLGNDEKISFLDALKSTADTLIEWAHKCSEEAQKAASATENAQYGENLIKLSEALKKVPENPAESFYEAVLSIYVLFSYDPDSLGTLDRTLYDFYKNDIEKGIITRDEAKELLQELFLMLQATTPHTSDRFTRGGESHFCVGGYDENHNDIFNDFSMLILEAMTELPTFIPQISLRWTEKLPFETFLKVFEMSVKDNNKRIAFINDELKIQAATEIAHIPYEIACRYSSVGCNEVAYPGGFVAGTTTTNIVRSMANTMHNRAEELTAAKTFDEFFEIYKSELFKDIDQMLLHEDEFMRVRSQDTCYVTSLLFDGCIKNADTFTRGTIKYCIAGPELIGMTNVIDSLAIIKQFVYDEKIVTMREMTDALKNNWNGYEDLHTLITKKGKFFGNDDEISNYTAKLFADTLYKYTKDKTTYQGYHYIFGNLQGYNEHHKFFGDKTLATPDGRYNGEMLKFGLSQSGAYDREGLTALLNSVAQCDKHGIISGTASVTNVTLDEQLVKNPDNLPKTAKIFETYFKNGGSHFQLNYTSAEDLKKAQITPEEYKNIRVRVSGFSDFFVNLATPIQDDVIKRTVKSK